MTTADVLPVAPPAATPDRVLPGTPGAALLLDDDALAAWLRTAGGPRLADAGYRRRYLRVKPGAGGVARLVPADPAAPELFLAVWHRRAAAKLAKGAQRAGRHLAHADGDLLALVATAPGDRDLPGLRALVDTGDARGRRVAREVRRALRDRGPGRTLAWKPQRRWVGRFDDPAGGAPLVVRVYRPGALAGPRAAYRTLADLQVLAAGPRVPHPVAADPSRGVLVTEHLPGSPLDGLLATRPAVGVAALPAAGAVLARLHALPVLGRGGDPLTAEQAAVRATGDLLALLLPALPARLHPTLLADEVVHALGRVGAGPTSPVHGDLSADQLLVGPDLRLALLDLDEAGTGATVADLVDPLADWTVRDPDTAAAHHAALLAGYVAAGGRAPDAARVAPWLAARLLRRAVQPFRTCAPDWPAATVRVLTVVRRVLDRHGAGA